MYSVVKESLTTALADNLMFWLKTFYIIKKMEANLLSGTRSF